MRHKKGEGDRTENRRFHITVFGCIVLAGMLILTFRTQFGHEAVLFDKNSEITLYAKTAAGAKPALNAAKFFPDEKLDPAQFTYDLSECDFNTPGMYRVPVYYGQKKTDCVIQLEVLPAGGRTLIPSAPSGENDKTTLRE